MLLVGKRIMSRQKIKGEYHLPYGTMKAKIVETLREYPNVWFDNKSMAYTINATRRTMSRYRKFLKENSLIVLRGRYFRASKILREMI